MTAEIFRTPHEAIDAHPAGWFQLRSGREIMRLPAIDTRQRLASGEPLFARPDYRTSLAWCSNRGFRLATPDEIEEVHRVGLNVLVTMSISAALNAARECDERTWTAIRDAGWAHGVPVLTFKPWVAGAPPGRSWLMGGPVPELAEWTPPAGQRGHRSGPGWIQPRPGEGSLGPHDDRHVDYSSRFYATRKPPGGWLDRIREDADEILDRSLAGFARLVAPVAPHGWRCSVAELVTDARALGTWRPAGAGYQPKIGDLVISGRSGGDPTKGGTGHVERVSQIRDVDAIGVHPGELREVWTIGGNEGNTWIEAPFRALPLGWIDYPADLGAACVTVARVELAASVREVPGLRANPRIQEYHAGTRRKGPPRAGLGADGGDLVLSTASDEIPWCASSASWCCARALGLV